MKKLLFIILVFISFSVFSQNVKISKCNDFEVMKFDIGTMTWDEAIKKVAKLGDGWRLPSIEELFIMYDKRDEIAGFEKGSYWSSTEFNSDGGTTAWYFDFSNGNAGNYYLKSSVYYVHAVRDLK